MRSGVATRTRMLGVFFIAAALFLVLRLYFVQVVHGDDYRRDAVSQYVAENTDTEDRGTIYFTTKDKQLVTAAVMESGWRIALQPKFVVDAESTYSAINAVTSIDKQRFLDAAARVNDPYEEVAIRVDDEAAALIRKLKLPGVLLVADQWRAYPGQDLASHALGFVGFKGDKREGVYGLERQYEKTLNQASTGLYVNPFAEIFSNIQSLLSFDPVEHKGSLITTIEPRVQQQLQTTLDGVMDTYTPEFAGGIVMDPKTGALYAIGGVPSFDPNTYNLARVEDYTNRLVEGRYELGSIMKPLTVAAGIDSGAITATTTYNDKGCITVSTYKICNFDQKARGVVPMQEILSQSLNLGVSFVTDRMGYDIFTKYMNAYGFAQETGVDLPNEVQGDLRPLGLGENAAVNYDTASFGQGIAVSPMEMIRALSVLANEGKMPNPHVVSGMQYESGITRDVRIPGPVPVLQPASAEAVTEMLIKVFDTSLLEGELKQEHYSIAAKTGTAQIPKPGGGYYPPGTYLHSFFGYFPAREPRFIIFLFAYKPNGQQYASATLARPFMEIAKFLINYYNVPPDR